MQKHFGNSGLFKAASYRCNDTLGKGIASWELGVEKQCVEYEGVFDMSKELLGVSALGLMIIGEFLAIYSEVVTARIAQAGGGSWPVFIMPVVLMCFAGICLLGAYWLGYLAVGDIWVVTVVSVTSLLLLEPVVIWALFHELPGRGALIGFCLGALGMLSTVLL